MFLSADTNGPRRTEHTMAKRPTAPKLSRRQRRLRYAARRATWVAVAAAVVAGLIAADRLGVFGRAPQDDWARYDGQTFRCVHVVDGDTLDVDVADTVRRRQRTRVRLWGVDTPETVKPDAPVQHFGPEASAFARQACLNQVLRLRLDPARARDHYGRLLAYVILPDGRMLNRILVEQGYGYADPRFDHEYKSGFRTLQTEARKARRGLWQAVRAPDLPYYYRGKIKLPQ